MEIYFCDLCNESVPQTDLDSGRAHIRKGRIICPTCEGAMSQPDDAEPVAGIADRKGGAAPSTTAGHLMGQQSPTAVLTPSAAALRPGVPLSTPAQLGVPPRRRSSSDGLSWIALLTALACAWWFYNELADSDRRENARLAEVRSEIKTAGLGIQETINELEAANERTSARMNDRMRDQRTLVDRGLTVLREENQALNEALDHIGTRLTGLGELAGRIDENRADARELQRAVTSLVDEFDRLETRLEEFETVSLVAPIEQSPLTQEALPAWWGLVADLTSANSGTRWSAVTSLGETGDPAVVEHLTPLLRDPDIFVRMATARVLGDLAAAEGIPHLIEALEDAEPPVREAAVVALRQITGRNFRFDPLADEADRTRKVRSWQEWWRKARDEYLGQGGESGS